MEECPSHAYEGKEAGKLMARSPSPLWCSNQDLQLCWVDVEKVEKEQKGSNLITDETTNEDNNCTKEKGVECPILVARLGIIEPNLSTDESLWQALYPVD